MTTTKRRLLVVTNLHPVPWAPNRASFNAQQFSRLAKHFELATIILVPWLEWWQNRKQCQHQANLRYLPYFYIPKLGRALYPFFQRMALRRQVGWIKAFKADAVLASWAYPDAVATLAALAELDIPCFIKVHGTDINENILHPQRLKQIIAAMDKAQAVFCPSQMLASLLQQHGVAGAKLRTIYNGVDKAVFYPGEKQAQKLIFVGNMLKTKGVVELYQAFKLLQSNYPDLHLDMVGSGPLLAELHMKAEQDGIAERIHFTGSLPLAEVAKKIRQASLLVLPSYREGLPNVVLEAFASATPVVASCVGGIPEVVSDEVGVLVEEISAEAFAKAIEHALQQPWSSTALLAKVAEFDWELNAQLVTEQLEQGIGKVDGL